MSGMLRGAKGSAPFRSGGSSSSGSPSVGNGHSKSAVNGSNPTSGLGSWPNTSGSGGSGSTSTSFSSSQHSDSSMHANLGLHGAAASGNVGLVKFALDNGQPHTSVLNGLLPLHAACSGGNESVVRMLLAYGADVNAPRLRMQRGPSGGSVAGMGAEGSTPLHFAAANGHSAIVRILLDHGARPVAKDKEGMTPEALAIAQHQSACVSLLRNCIALYGPGGLAGPSAAPDSTQSPDKTGEAQGPSDLRAQRSFESLSSAAAGVKASLRHHRKQALAKVSSNPNLKSNSTHTSNASPPPPLPIPLSARNGLEAANGGGSTHSTPPNTLSSSSQQQPRDSKRRPSLPSIFEKASHPASAFRNALLAQPSSALSHPSESVEELTQDGEAARMGTTKQDLLSAPSANSGRPTLRLQAKKSLTGLLSKASSGSASESSSPTDVRARISPDVAPSKGTSAFAFLQEKATTPSLASTMNRNRSGSSDLIGQPSPHSLFRSDVTSASSYTSPTSSVENFDAANRATGGAALTFRPRKSSNLMTTSSPLAGQMHLGPQQHQAGKDAQILRPEEVEQGVRKRSQSTTSVPRRPSLATLGSKTSLEGRSTPPLHPAVPSGRNRVDLDGRADFLDATSEHPARSRTPTMNRYASQPGGSRSNRSPLLPSRHLVEERGDGMPMLPPSPSLSLHQLHSQHSSSSLVSSASSSHATNRRPSRQNLRGKAVTSSIAGAGMLGGEEVAARARSGRSPSRSEGVASKASSSSLRTHAGLSSQEQALAILRSAEEASREGTQINLTQMLAAYGEALAQERDTLRAAGPSSSPPQRADKQSSATLLNSSGPHRSPASLRAGLPRSDSSLSPSTSYRMDPHASPQTTPSRPDRGTASTSSRSLSSLKVSDSPVGIRSPSADSGRVESPFKEASSSAAPRAQTEVAEAGGTLQVETANPLRLESSEETSPDEVATSHRHSPSLPTELWAAPANSTETTPRSRGRMNQHRSTTSDPHSSAQEKTSLQSPDFLQHIHKTASVNELRFRPDTPRRGSDLTLAADEKSGRMEMTGGGDEGGGPDDGSPVQFAAAYREAPRTIVHDPSHSPVPSGKRKGSVKTFLHNIKSNVVK